MVTEGRLTHDRRDGGEKSFWISRPDDWVINRKMKRLFFLNLNGQATVDE